MKQRFFYFFSIVILLTGILPANAASASQNDALNQTNGCDQAALDQAEATFRSRLSENGQVPVNDPVAETAAMDYIRLSKNCFDATAAQRSAESLQGGDPTFIDEGPIDRYAGQAENFKVSDAKWGNPTLGTPGGTVTYSFMGSGLDLSTEGVPAYGDSVAITALPGFQPCFITDIRTAFAAWSAVSNIQFVETTDSNTAFDAVGATGDIRVGTHYIDGPSKTLAHAYLPYNYLSGDGDLHFDKDENWTCDTSGIDIGIVALHEIGHTIGLYHDDTAAIAVMDPYYNSSLNTLQSDDINGAQAIYGSPPLEIAAPNDDFASATNINTSGGLPFTESLDTTGATQDVTDPDGLGPCDGHFLNIGNNTVWYQYTPPSNSFLHIDTLGSDYDTYLAVWTGTEGNLSLVDCDDDTTNTFQSEMVINATGGTTYYIEVAEYNGQPPFPTGTGVGGNLAFNMELTTASILPFSYTFQDQLFRTSNAPKTIFVFNNNLFSITLGTLQGSSSVGTTWTSSKSFFIENDNCSGVTLIAGSNCTFDVRFLPWSLGLKTGTITVPSDDPSQPFVLTMSGNSIPGTQLLLNRSFDNYSATTGLPIQWLKNPGFKIGIDGVDSSWSFHGPYSVKLVGDGDLKIFSQMVDKSGSPGDDFSFFVTTHADGIPNDADRWLMQVMFYNGSTIVENRNVKLKTGTYEFRRITQTYTATTNYTHIMFRIHFGKSSGTAWVDLSSLQWAP